MNLVDVITDMASTVIPERVPGTSVTIVPPKYQDYDLPWIGVYVDNPNSVRWSRSLICTLSFGVEEDILKMTRGSDVTTWDLADPDALGCLEVEMVRQVEAALAYHRMITG